MVFWDTKFGTTAETTGNSSMKFLVVFYVLFLQSAKNMNF
jgi:hypothetical protein